MSPVIAELAKKYDRLPLQQRVAYALFFILLLAFLFNVALYSRQGKALQQLNQQLASQSGELRALRIARNTKEAEQARERARHMAAQAEIDALSAQIAGAASVLGEGASSNSASGALIRTLIETDRTLQLVSFHTLPGMVFYAPPGDKSGGQLSGASAQALQRTIYKHGVELEVRGTYPALLAYMNRLERYPKRLYWSEAKLNVAAYPEAVLKLVVYYLSDQPVSLLG
jgi:MSHA biogenesis protein MshJ